MPAVGAGKQKAERYAKGWVWDERFLAKEIAKKETRENQGHLVVYLSKSTIPNQCQNSAANTMIEKYFVKS